MAQQYRPLKLILFLCIAVALGISCSKNEVPEQPDTNPVDTILQACSDHFLAASFHLMEPADLFTEPNLFAGQPAYYFNELVEKEERITIINKFRNQFNQLPDLQKSRLTDQFLKWCRANETLNTVEQSVSVEELFSLLASDPKTNPIFKKALGEQASILENSIIPDTFSSFSSAEIHFYRQQFITKLSTHPSEMFSDVLQRIEKFSNR